MHLSSYVLYNAHHILIKQNHSFIFMNIWITLPMGAARFVYPRIWHKPLKYRGWTICMWSVLMTCIWMLCMVCVLLSWQHVCVSNRSWQQQTQDSAPLHCREFDCHAIVPGDGNHFGFWMGVTRACRVTLFQGLLWLILPSCVLKKSPFLKVWRQRVWNMLAQNYWYKNYLGRKTKC